MIEESTLSASAPRIHKAPFLVFDGILVFVAVALAFSAENPLSPLMFFWILFCVAAGGVVACLPFWMEFRDRVRLAEYELRERQNGPGNAQWQYVDARLVEMSELLQKNHLRLCESVDRLMRLEAQPQGPDAAQIITLAEETVHKRWPALREELLASLGKRSEALLAHQQEQAATASTAIVEQLTTLQAEFSASLLALAALEAKITQMGARSQESSPTVAEPAIVEEASAAPVAEPAATVVDVEVDAGVTAAPTPEAESSLAAPAEPTSEVEPSLAASAESAATILEDEAAFESDPEVDLNDGEAFAADIAAAEADAAEEAAEAEEAEALSNDDFTADADESAATSAAETPVAEQAAELLQAETEISAVVEQPALIETPETPRPARAKKAAANACATLVAQVLIGIGNKPYVRGEGPGLSTEKGVPMQFVEIGKWEWVCPEAGEPVLLQIYKNDEVPSSLGEILLEPGQRRAVTPTFPQ